MENKRYYIYKMYNKENELLYIGKTNNLYGRLNAHFSKNTLNKQPWKIEVEFIKILEFYNQYDIDIIEIYLIGKEKPKYNIDCVYSNQSPSFDIKYKIKKKFTIKSPLNAPIPVNTINKSEPTNLCNKESVLTYFNLDDKVKHEMSSKLKIYTKNHLKNEYNKTNTLSISWFNKNDKYIDRIKKDTSNFFKNDIGSKSCENKWTTYNIYEDKLKSKGYIKGFINKNEPLENFNNCIAYAYLRNDFPSDIEMESKNINPDFYSIYYLVSVIKYVTIDLNKEFNVYIPSKRIFNILKHWMGKDRINKIN